MTNLSLYRIMLFGQEIEKLKKFYTDNFGFTVIEEISNEWVVLKAGQVELALHKVGKGYESESGQFRVESNAKLIFKIDGSLSSFRQGLIEKGVIVQDIKSFEGYHSLFCDGEDIEGNVFQIEQQLSN